MALFGVNFSVYFCFCCGSGAGRCWTRAALYGGIMLTAMFVIAADITPLFSGFGEAFHHASFTVSSVMTTTGFATEDFNLWPQLSRAILCILMVVGASAGSTGGGIKVTTLSVVLLAVASVVRGRDEAMIFGRRIDHKTVYKSLTILMLSLFAVIAASMTLFYNTGPELNEVNSVFRSCVCLRHRGAFSGCDAVDRTPSPAW